MFLTFIIKINKKVTGIVLFYIIKSLFSVIKKDYNIWIIIGRNGKFVDNAKYFFLYLQNNKKIRSYFITTNKEIYEMISKNGYASAYLFSLRGIFLLARAGVVIVDNFDWSTSAFGLIYALTYKSYKIQLWHGIPLKKIEYDNVFDNVLQSFVRRRSFRDFLMIIISFLRYVNYDIILCPSRRYVKIFSSAFRTDSDKLFICNYPRCEFLLNPNKFRGWKINISSIFSFLLKVKNEKNINIILYLPTFREKNRKILTLKDIEEINNFCLKHNVLFVIKPHPFEKFILKELPNSYNIIKKKNILLLHSDEDIYPYLLISDILITDISSIYFDYLLLNKPIIHYFPDYRDYIINDRNLYFRLEKVAAGQICFDIKCMMHNLAEILNNKHREEKIRVTLRKKLYDDLKNSCGCNDIVKRIQKLIVEKY